MNINLIIVSPSIVIMIRKSQKKLLGIFVVAVRGKLAKNLIVREINHHVRKKNKANSRIRVNTLKRFFLYK